MKYWLLSIKLRRPQEPQSATQCDAAKQARQLEMIRLHEIVENGSLTELKNALRTGIDVDAPGHCGATALMFAMSSRDLAKAKLLLQHGADPELTDDFNHTALRHAVYADFADGVEWLLKLGVDRGYSPKYPLKEVRFDFPSQEIPMPEELAGIISDKEWQCSLESTKELGKTPTVQPIISEVQSVEVLRLFLAAGDDLQLAPTEIKRLYIGLSNGLSIRCTAEDYNEHKSPRFGVRNPERMDFAFWRDMVRTGGNAYSARARFHDTNAFGGSAVWCFDRFGSSLTPLDDHRFVEIAGEHEDFYDPDFCIYNDVVVHDGLGNFDIYGYPKDVFPPTDFHTATLVGQWIYIIGCLGYVDQRVEDFTPVYRLKLHTWEIQTVRTSGEMPGWIHKHRAIYDANANAIHVSGGELHVIAQSGTADLVANPHDFQLNLSSLEWARVKRSESSRH